MLAKVNDSNDFRPLFRRTHSLHSTDDAGQIPGVLSLYKQPSDRLDLTDRLYFNELLPHMESTGQPFIKESRRKYWFLENSLLAHKSRKVYEQYHWDDKNREENTIVVDKGLCGQGANKRVWDLKPLFPFMGPPMVRARFNWDYLRNVKQDQLKKLEELESEVNGRFLLIPEAITYMATCEIMAMVQMMPKALGGDLFKDLKKLKCLSYLGHLRAMRDAGLGLMDMHEKRWAHLDFKPGNLLLMGLDPDWPIVKLADFDLARKFGENEVSIYCVGTPLYMDPACLNEKAKGGLEYAKIHDQFSFGISLCEVLTGFVPRENLCFTKRGEWVTENDLNAVRGFSELDQHIQDIIRGCCVGPTEERPYRLPEFVAILDKVIVDFVVPENLGSVCKRQISIDSVSVETGASVDSEAVECF